MQAKWRKTSSNNPVFAKLPILVAKSKNKPNKIHQLSPMQQTGCPEKDIIL